MTPSACRASLPLLVVALVASWLLSGCGAQCAQVRQDYEGALAQETQLVEELASGEEPAQLGISVRTDLLNQVANTALQSALQTGLQAVSSVDVGAGQSIGVRTQGDVLNLTVEADEACNHCFRIGGRLDGRVTLDVPMVGERSADLGGDISLVAPVSLRRGQNGGGELYLDLNDAARLGQSTLTARLSGVRDTWARAIQSELSDILLSRLFDEVDAVELLAFQMPDFGIPGMEVFPVELISDAESGTIFAGFATNIAALEDQPGIEAVTELEDDQNLAISFNPNLVVHGLSLMMKSDVIPRTYTTDGEPLRGGPAHVTIDDFSFSRGRVGELPMALDFRVFNMPDADGMCFWFNGRASGRVALRGQNLEVSLTELDITESSLPQTVVEATRWSQAEFLRGGKQLVRQSLSAEKLEVPGGQMQFEGLSIELEGNSVVLKGSSVVRGEQREGS